MRTSLVFLVTVLLLQLLAITADINPHLSSLQRSINNPKSTHKHAHPSTPPSSPSSFVPPTQTRYPPGTVHNPNIDASVDCALRAFTIEAAIDLQAATSTQDWGQLAIDAFQMVGQCPGWVNQLQKQSRLKQQQNLLNRLASPADVSCALEVFVSESEGEDDNVGTINAPYATIVAALAATRAQRPSMGYACITIRAGSYYLGSNAAFPDPSKDSRIGPIHLTSLDSYLVLRAFTGEEHDVILSAGTPLSLNWQIYQNTSMGPILSAPLPSSIDTSPNHFNELYTDTRRAVRAKYPNGDPSTHGIHTNPSGYSQNTQGWLNPKVYAPATEIHLSTPSRNGTAFQNFMLGMDGVAEVWDPPTNFWAVASPPGGVTYQLPGGLVYNDGGIPNVQNWTHAEDALIFAIHGNHWASWVFQASSLNTTNNTIVFAKGGFQEARGAGTGDEWYVSNVLAELDEPNEYYIDHRAKMLYYMPNTTAPTTFIASQLPCILSISGNENMPVHDVIISGLTFAHTASTFMRVYEVPSGGDVSLHRGGAVFIEGSEHVTLYNNVLTLLGGNAIIVSDYNYMTNISTNEVSWIGDSGIISVGSSSLIDGVSDHRQPYLTNVDNNLIHETGIYVKQSAPFLQSVSRASQITHNVFFNIPRAAVNTNDGFWGNHTLAYNVLF